MTEFKVGDEVAVRAEIVELPDNADEVQCLLFRHNRRTEEPKRFYVRAADLTPWPTSDDTTAAVVEAAVLEVENWRSGGFSNGAGFYYMRRIAAAEAERDRYAAALREHAKPLGEWDMLWVAPDGTMPGRVADAHWARAHIDALLAALEENDAS